MVRTIMIVEMAGKPAEHVEETLNIHMNHLRDFKFVGVHSLMVSEPKLIESSEGVYTCFSEADFETDTFDNMIRIIFEFMPSSVEVIEPSSIEITSKEMTDFLNNVSGRLHNYDNVAKIAQMRINEMGRELVRLDSPLIKKVGGPSHVSTEQKKEEPIKEKKKTEKKSKKKGNKRIKKK